MTLAGLRPGEKLFEEKLMAEEGLKKTKNKLIHIGCPIPFNTEQFLHQLMKSYEWGSAILFAILFFTNNLISDERLGSNFAGNSNTFALFMMVAFFFTSWQFLYYEKDRLKKGIAGIIMIIHIYIL